jgi:hypothetical protein
MGAVNATNVHIENGKLYLSTMFRRFIVEEGDILGFKVLRVPSLFEEIGIELQSDRNFIITERVNGFFDLANFLQIEELFGPLWYSDAENGRELLSKRNPDSDQFPPPGT